MLIDIICISGYIRAPPGRLLKNHRLDVGGLINSSLICQNSATRESFINSILVKDSSYSYYQLFEWGSTQSVYATLTISAREWNTLLLHIVLRWDLFFRSNIDLPSLSTTDDQFLRCWINVWLLVKIHISDFLILQAIIIHIIKLNVLLPNAQLLLYQVWITSISMHYFYII